MSSMALPPGPRLNYDLDVNADLDDIKYQAAGPSRGTDEAGGGPSSDAPTPTGAPPSGPLSGTRAAQAQGFSFLQALDASPIAKAVLSDASLSGIAAQFREFVRQKDKLRAAANFYRITMGTDPLKGLAAWDRPTGQPGRPRAAAAERAAAAAAAAAGPDAEERDESEPSVLASQLKLGARSERVLLSEFGLRDTLSPEYARALAVVAGCEEGQLRAYFRRLKDHVRHWGDRMERRGQARAAAALGPREGEGTGIPESDGEGEGEGGRPGSSRNARAAPSERSIVRSLIEPGSGGLAKDRLGDFFSLSRTTESFETVGRLLEILLRTSDHATLSAVSYNLIDDAVRRWAPQLSRAKQHGSLARLIRLLRRLPLTLPMIASAGLMPLAMQFVRSGNPRVAAEAEEVVRHWREQADQTQWSIGVRVEGRRRPKKDPVIAPPPESYPELEPRLITQEEAQQKKAAATGTTLLLGPSKVPLPRGLRGGPVSDSGATDSEAAKRAAGAAPPGAVPVMYSALLGIGPRAAGATAGPNGPANGVGRAGGGAAASGPGPSYNPSPSADATLGKRPAPWEGGRRSGSPTGSTPQQNSAKRPRGPGGLPPMSREEVAAALEGLQETLAWPEAVAMVEPDPVVTYDLPCGAEGSEREVIDMCAMMDLNMDQAAVEALPLAGAPGAEEAGPGSSPAEPVLSDDYLPPDPRAGVKVPPIPWEPVDPVERVRLREKMVADGYMFYGIGAGSTRR